MVQRTMSVKIGGVMSSWPADRRLCRSALHTSIFTDPPPIGVAILSYAPVNMALCANVAPKIRAGSRSAPCEPGCEPLLLTSNSTPQALYLDRLRSARGESARVRFRDAAGFG
jgi:hypothetical protein